MIQCNCTEGANAPDYFIYAQNPNSIAWEPSAGTTGSKTGAIKICGAGGLGTAYIRTYDSAV